MIRGLRIWKRPLALALSLLAAWALWVGLTKAWNVVLLGFLAILIAAMFSFPVGWFSRLMPRAAAVVLTVLLTFGTVGGVVALATPLVVEQGKQLLDGSRRDAEGGGLAAARQRRQDGAAAHQRKGRGGNAEGQGAGGGGDRRHAHPEMRSGTWWSWSRPFVLLIVLAALPGLFPVALRARHPSDAPRSFEADFDELWARLGGGLRGWVGGTVVAMFLMGSVTAVGLWLLRESRGGRCSAC
jgi:predicted PurR-regulated permease PerM